MSDKTSIAGLYIYPIKSCAGISVENFEFDNKGPINDRRWMLVADKQGEGIAQFITQRKYPRMALIKTSIEDGQVFAFTDDPSLNDVKFELPTQGEPCQVEVWSDTVQALDCGDQAAKWFSDFLQVECRLVYQPLELFRQVDLEFAQEGDDVGFADGFPLLIINQASVDFLNQESIEQGLGIKFDSRRFRPNMVVQGAPAFSENNWQSVSTENNQYAIVKPCQRCAIPTINPDTAERDKAAWALLLKHCAGDGADAKKIFFGQNALFSQQARIAVGQPVEIMKR